MNLLLKIILIGISILILLILVFFTYTINSISSIEEVNYNISETGTFKINNANNNFTFSKISEENKTSTGNLIIKKISTSNSIFYSSGSSSPTIVNNNINIGKGIYIFDLREINKIYNIDGLGFKINDVGPGIFIINTLNPKQNIIFSVSSLLNLNLFNISTKQEMTSVYLFPNTYLIFDPLKNKFLKNADLLKIGLYFTLGYYNNSILDNNSIISKDFLNLVSIKNNNIADIINNTFLYINHEYIKSINIIKNFTKSSLGLFPSEAIIIKYFDFFINDIKKNIYYKNIIIRDIQKVILKNQKKYTISNILSNYKTLQKTDINGANEIKNIIIYYYDLVVKSNSNIGLKKDFLKLLDGLNIDKYNIKYDNLILLESTFFNYNFGANIFFYKKINIFKKEYIKNINKESDLKLKNLKIDYLLYFFKNILLSKNILLENNTKDLINIFNDYVNISTSFYISSSDTIKRIGLLNNSKILNNFIKLFEKKYFLNDISENGKISLIRNTNGLIQKKENIDLNLDELILLEKNIKEIYSFFDKYKHILKPNIRNKDKFLINHYFILKRKYNEYFSALKDYELYLIEFDKVQSSLLNTKSINQKTEKIFLSIEKAKNYLFNFNGVNKNNIDIQIMDYNYCNNPSKENESLNVITPYCYKVSNFIVDSLNISFLLYPFEKNKIDNIFIEEDPKRGSYKLDDIEDKLLKNKGTQSEEDEEFTFKDFFINTFSKKISNNNKNIYVSNQPSTLDEPATIKSFKRITLLGNNGEFSNLEGFLDIKYLDLIVTQIGTKLDIFIKKGALTLEHNDTLFIGELSSKYDFTNLNSFINPQIKLYDIKTNSLLLFGNTIKIKGIYPVNTIKNDIKLLFDNYNIINFIVNTIKLELKYSNIGIVYNKETNEIIFTSKDIYIKILNSEIIEAKLKNKNILNSIVYYKKLPIILNNLTK